MLEDQLLVALRLAHYLKIALYEKIESQTQSGLLGTLIHRGPLSAVQLRPLSLRNSRPYALSGKGVSSAAKRYHWPVGYAGQVQLAVRPKATRRSQPCFEL